MKTYTSLPPYNVLEETDLYLQKIFANIGEEKRKRYYIYLTLVDSEGNIAW